MKVFVGPSCRGQTSEIPVRQSAHDWLHGFNVQRFAGIVSKSGLLFVRERRLFGDIAYGFSSHLGVERRLHFLGGSGMSWLCHS